VGLSIISTADGLAVAQTQTDDDGRFWVGALPAGTYEVRHQLALSGRHRMSWPIVEAGSDRPVEIRVANLHNHGPQPKRPSRP